MHDESSLISYALFIKGSVKIAKFCLVETKVRHANLAVSLEGYMLAINLMATTKLQIRCLTDTYLEEITPPIENYLHWEWL